MTQKNTKLHIHGECTPSYNEILNDDAQDFIVDLLKHFQDERDALLTARQSYQQTIDAGQLPNFDQKTNSIREANWKIRGIPNDLMDRRVEITGPVDRKMIINALNAPVNVFMADFEDSLAPTWDNIMQGQINLRDAVQITITYTNPSNNKHYQLHDDPAVLITRVRGLHLPEKNIHYNGKPIVACLLDFALYFYHNYQTLLEQGSGPYFYLPKLQSADEAAWWSKVFSYTEDRFKLNRGTIKATLLIETLPAVFAMDEMLYAMRDHVVGLNCGRWDYIFSYIKTLRKYKDRILPDRQAVTMDQPFLDAYSHLLIHTCHKRGAFAMGGMSAFIPSKDPQQQIQIMEKIREDKAREARNGHDGTWVAHPGLADIAMQTFNAILKGKTNQLDVLHNNAKTISANNLLSVPTGECTEAGLRHNLRVAVHYIASWLDGNGCVPIYGLMEDAATAEISRTSIWQWLHHQQRLSDGTLVTPDYCHQTMQEELAVIANEVGQQKFDQGPYKHAAELMLTFLEQPELTEFLTLPAYKELV